MNTEQNLSLWEAISKRTKKFPALSDNIEVDIAIIGGGITGVTTAARLIAAGKKVAIIEANKIGGGTTGYSTGNLYVPVQPLFQGIVKKFNLEIAKQVAHSRKFAIDYIEKTIKENNIQCQFKRRFWYAYTNNENNSTFNEEVELFKKLGLAVNEEVHVLPFSFPFKKAAVISDQARFNPLQYVISLAEKIAEEGCLIFEDTRVLDMIEKSRCQLKTTAGKVTAEQVLMATHTPVGINATQMFTAPYRSYVVAMHLNKDECPEGHFRSYDTPEFISCTHPVNGDHPELVMVAGSHHKVGQGDNMQEHYNQLETFLRSHTPAKEVAYRWSAQHYQTGDDVPYIGLASKKTKNVFLATGYFADGLVYGTLAGVLLADAMLDKKNQLAMPYDPSRSPLGSLGFLLKENLNVYLQYLKDYPLLTKQNFSEIKAGEGKICEIGREKCAVSRDCNNNLHIVSAVCTHMKCIVNWNNAEKTWDCPCHGSRFTQEGKVIEGPATVDLEQKK